MDAVIIYSGFCAVAFFKTHLYHLFFFINTSKLLKIRNNNSQKSFQTTIVTKIENNSMNPDINIPITVWILNIGISPIPILDGNIRLIIIIGINPIVNIAVNNSSTET
jgi:hypothetical protein